MLSRIVLFENLITVEAFAQGYSVPSEPPRGLKTLKVRVFTVDYASTNSLSHHRKLYGAEPAAGNDTQRSLQTGERVRIEVPETVCDGLRSVIPGELTFPILQKCRVEVVTAPEEAVKSAAYWLLETLKLLVEPSGAIAVAAWIAGAIAYAPEAEEVVDVVLVLSGGNADPATVAGWKG